MRHRLPTDWPWSSYGAHTGRAAPPARLDSRALHKRLAPHPPVREGPGRYVGFVAQGKGVKLWDGAFMKRMQKQIIIQPGSEVPRAQHRLEARPLTYYLDRTDRDTAVLMAYREGGHTQTAIAGVTGLSIARVGRLISLDEARGNT